MNNNQSRAEEEELTQKIAEYMKYIDEHCQNVKNVWKAVQKYLTGEYWVDDFFYYIIDRLINDHDKSKREEEFESFRQKFFPCSFETPDEVIVERAIHAHYNANPHHWQYWLSVKVTNSVPVVKPMGMPLVFIMEMLCDWSAMEIKVGGDILKWYNANKTSMLMTNADRKCIEEHLPLFNKAIKDVLEIKQGE